MSNQETTSELKEVAQTVSISAEDLKHIRDFFTHFNIKMPATLSTALDAFAAEQSYENQDRIRIELAATMYEVDHPIFKDELFKSVIENSSRILYDARFGRQLEGELTPQK
jgi:hypothetical protein